MFMRSSSVRNLNQNQKERSDLRGGLATFNIKKRSGISFREPAYDAFDSKEKVQYTIEVKYKGWRKTRHVIIKDQHGVLLRTVVYDRAASTLRKECSVGDDGSLYFRHHHFLSPDLFSLELSIRSPKEVFNLNRQGSKYSGPVFSLETLETVAVITETGTGAYTLKNEGSIPTEYFLALVGLIIAKKDRDAAKRALVENEAIGGIPGAVVDMSVS